ncbi:MAG: hypothetical protein ACLFV7_01260 [Phycisphaerae bacterium]
MDGMLGMAGLAEAALFYGMLITVGGGIGLLAGFVGLVFCAARPESSSGVPVSLGGLAIAGGLWAATWFVISSRSIGTGFVEDLLWSLIPLLLFVGGPLALGIPTAVIGWRRHRSISDPGDFRP